MQPNAYHEPVMLRECVDALVEDIDGVYVDVTFGGGGHSREVLSSLSDTGKLIAFDQDADAVKNAIEDPRFSLVQSNFRFLKNNLRFMGITGVDGVLADLGVSSHQIDTPERGFSIRFDGPLDMRMGSESKKTARDVLNRYSAAQLERVFRDYGELREWRSLTAKVIEAREEKPFHSTMELVAVADKACRDPKRNRFMSKLFQALRIEVNGEMEALEALLLQTADVIKPGGRLVVMAYHSLEDRLVKNFMRSGKFEGDVEKDFFGNPLRPFKPLPGMPISPSEDELKQNTRSRSAKLRVAIRNDKG
jgi:16S rRNA (cytosine1402-N4)-methyltransferase